jgi:hypothetical protein
MLTDTAADIPYPNTTAVCFYVDCAVYLVGRPGKYSGVAHRMAASDHVPMTRIAQNPDDWQSGYNAGMSGGSATPPPEVTDALAWARGFVAGVAARARATAAMRDDQPDAGA